MKSLSKINADSFLGKLYLLVIEKLIIGAIIAIAFLTYDWYRTKQLHQINLKTQETQLKFERARLLKEILPAIRDSKSDVISRAYLLQTAVYTGSIEPNVAIEMCKLLLDEKVPINDFKRIILTAMPDGIEAISRQGIRLLNIWSSKKEHPVGIIARFEPEVPKKLEGIINEYKAWQSALFESLPVIEVQENSPLESEKFLSNNLIGLYFLFQSNDSNDALRLSRSPNRGVRLIGNLRRVIMSGGEKEAAEYIGKSLSIDLSEIKNINYARTIIAILKFFGIRSGEKCIFAEDISKSIAKILVDDSFRHRIAWIEKDAPTKLRKKWYAEQEAAERHYSLQYEAGVLLTLMKGRVNNAESILIKFIDDLYLEMLNSNDYHELEKICSRYRSKVSVRFAIEILLKINSKKSRLTLQKIKSLGDKKIKHLGGFISIKLENL